MTSMNMSRTILVNEALRFGVPEGDIILDAALSQGVVLPHLLLRAHDAALWAEDEEEYMRLHLDLEELELDEGDDDEGEA